MKITPKDILVQWMEAVNEKNIEHLLNLYDENAILIPTFSNRLINNRTKLRDYFEKLASYSELSIALHEKTLSFQKIDDEKFTICGIYCWRFIVEEELLSFEARFSYFVNIALANPIVHHHSSQVPRMI